MHPADLPIDILSAQTVTQGCVNLQTMYRVFIENVTNFMFPHCCSMEHKSFLLLPPERVTQQVLILNSS